MTKVASRQSVTHRRVFRIAIPIMLSNATTPLLGAVDTGVVGQLGTAVPIGAVGIGAIILALLYWFFGFLRLGTSGLASQARGRGDVSETSAILVRALAVGLLAGLALIILQIPIMYVAFALAPASPEVEEMARSYVSLRIFSAPAAIAMYGITGWLIATERTGTVLLVQLWTNGLNIVLDLIFVLKLGLGVEGVAAATVIAEWSGLLLGLALCLGIVRIGALRSWRTLLDRHQLKLMATLNTDIMIRSVLLEISFVTFLFLAADQGDITLAANQILLQFLHVTAYALDGFAFAAEALVGLSVGARTRADLRRSVALTALWSAAMAVLLATGFAVFGGLIINVMTTVPEVRLEAGAYLLWIIAAPIIGAPSWLLDGVFVGATRTRDMRNAMFQSIVIFAVTLAIMLPLWGNHGLWIALLTFFVARAVTLALRYPALERTAG